MNKLESRKVTLGYASLLCIAAWRAIQIDGESIDPARLAKTESALARGEASLGLYIQRTGDNLYISATCMPAVPQDPFEGGNRLVIQGPMVLSNEQLAALSAIDPAKFN